MSVKEVPARKRAEEADEMHYVPVQKLPQTVLVGYNPKYAMDQQLRKFCPGEEYVRDEERSNEVFDVYKVSRASFDKVQKGLQKEANDRLVRPDLNLTTKGGTKPIDEIKEERQTLDQFGSSLPTSTE